MSLPSLNNQVLEDLDQLLEKEHLKVTDIHVHYSKMQDK